LSFRYQDYFDETFKIFSQAPKLIGLVLNLRNVKRVPSISLLPKLRSLYLLLGFSRKGLQWSYLCRYTFSRCLGNP